MLVSEFMLQQTPVERVRGPWAAWLERWPSPDALAAAPAGEAVRAWGRLGYPRRALRLHQAAVVITERFGGEVPADRASLLSLPGVGSYTAAAVASFAYGRREVVLDTNVRRVVSRVVLGAAHPPPPRRRGWRSRWPSGSLPRDPGQAARWAVASMELGALVCRARDPALRRLPRPRPVRLAPRRLARHPPVRRDGDRRTPAPTGSAAAPCSPCSARPTDR